jgi:MtN3 and saliva related transmembrane protein
MLHGLLIGDYLLAAGFFLSILTCGTVSFLILYFRYLKKTPDCENNASNENA